MTIPSTERKAGPFEGDGANDAFPFTFKVFAEEDIAVAVTDVDGVTTVLVLDSDYSVALNADQDADPGGTVTYPISGTELAADEFLAVYGNLEYDQPLDIPGGGNFNPTTLENQLDRMMMQIQQIRELIGRAALAPVTTDADVTFPTPEAGMLIGWNTAEDALQNYDPESTDALSFTASGTGAVTRTGQEKMRDIISILDFGGDRTGVDDSTEAFQAAVDAMPATGGAIYFPSGVYRLSDTITISKPVSLYGDGSGQTVGTTRGSYLKFYSLGTANGIVYDDVDGAFIRDLAIVADTATRPTGGSLVVLQGTSAGWYHHTWTNVLCAGGYNGMLFKNGFYFKAYSCVWKTFNGANVMLFNGASDANDVQSCEFTNCTIAAESSTTTDLVVLDGYAASTKFVACAFLFGRKGIWLTDRYTTSNDPDFLYVIGGGFENGEGDAICAEAGNHLMLTGVYVSTDGDRARCVFVGTGFGGEITMAGCYVRGGGRGGVWLEDGNANITGNTIINNNEAGPVTSTITNCANNGSGLIRVTTSAAHGYETNDMISVLNVVGTTEANGTWVITVINATTFDLTTNADSDTGAASAYANAYVSGGDCWLATASVRVLSGAEWVNVHGNTLGGGSGGVRSTEYGVHANADNVYVSNNQCQSVVLAPWKSTRNTRHSYGNKNLGVASGASRPDPYAVDGCLSIALPGTVTTGYKNFTNMTYVSGFKLRIVRATRVLSSAGGNEVTGYLYVNGSRLGTSLTQDGTSVSDVTYATPLIIDGTVTPQRVQFEVSAVTGTPTDLAWDYQFQIIH